MIVRRSEARGVRIAALIAGPRAGAPQPSPPDDLLEYLARGGCAGLIWHAWKGNPACTSPGWTALRHHYQAQVLTQAVQRQWLSMVASELAASHIPWLLLKGFSIARHYEVPATRPFSDLDILVHSDAAAAARQVLMPLASRHGIAVDLHSASVLPPIPVDRLIAQAEVATISGVRVPVLAAERQLVHACLHAAKHGLVRPIWLHDLNVLERTIAPRPWHRAMDDLLPRDRQLVQIVRAIAADVPGWTRSREPAHRAPRHLMRETLSAWGARDVSVGNSAHTLALTPGNTARLLRSRWPTTLRAASGLGLSPRLRPTSIIKAAWVAQRLPGFSRRLLRAARANPGSSPSQSLEPAARLTET